MSKSLSKINKGKAINFAIINTTGLRYKNMKINIFSLNFGVILEAQISLDVFCVMCSVHDHQNNKLFYLKEIHLFTDRGHVPL